MLRNKEKIIEKYRIPKVVQDIIPIKVIYKEGMAYMGNGRYSKVYRMQDINYASASADTKEVMLDLYQECLNTFECGQQSKITVSNRKLLRQEVEEKYRMKHEYDGSDKFRDELNNHFESKLSAINHYKQDKYITVTCEKTNDTAAGTHFVRIEQEMQRSFKKLGSNITPLDGNERLRIYHDFFRPGEENQYDFDLAHYMKLGQDFKDYIAPDSVEIKKDHLIIGNKYLRILYVKEYPSRVRDDIIEKLTSTEHNVMCSIDVYPVITEEARKKVDSIMDGIEMEASRWQRNQTKNGVVPFDLPYHLKERKRNIQGFADELNSGNQMMMLATVTLVHTADSLEELNEETEELMNVALGMNFHLSKLNFQQIEALNTVLPYGGMMRIAPTRTLTTRGVAALMPFSVQNFQQKNGRYYGENAINHELLIINNWALLNANYFIIGVSGSGKSFLSKLDIIQVLLAHPDVDVIIVDPENEFKCLTDTFSGDNINISSTSKNYINAMDINSAYGDDEDPIIVKAEFMLSFCEQVLGEQYMTAGKKTIIQRCVCNVLNKYRSNGYNGIPPTLVEVYEDIMSQPEEEARQLELELEMYVIGVMNIFAHQTNIDIDNRLVCFNTHNMSEQLMPVGMLTIEDFVWNRVTRNRNTGRLTLFVIDEISISLAHKRTAAYLARMWKRARKYGCACCGILQNASSLSNKESREMITNSQFSIIMNQRETEFDALNELFDVSPEQLDYVTNVSTGKGLIYINDTGSLIPFENNFPKDTELYKIMSTKPEKLEKKYE